MKKHITRFVVGLRDFAYYSIYRNKGAEIADDFYKILIKHLIAPYFAALVFGYAALSYRLEWNIPDIADGNVLIMIVVGLCVLAFYNFLISPVERMYNKYPIDLESIKGRYKSLRWKYVLFFIVGLVCAVMVPYLISDVL